MNWVTSLLGETATYWPLGSLDRYGNYTYGGPVQLKCKWEDEAERFTDKEGNERVSKSIVFVDREVAVGGFLAKGVVHGADPRSVSAAETIQGVSGVNAMGNTQDREIHALL